MGDTRRRGDQLKFPMKWSGHVTGLLSFILLLSTCTINTAQKIKEDVTVYELIPEEDENQTAVATLTYDEDFMGSAYTLCMWIFSVYRMASSVIAALYSSNNVLILSTQEGCLYVSCNQYCPMVLPNNSHLKPHAWQHVCIIVNNASVSLLLGGIYHELTHTNTCPSGLNQMEGIVLNLGNRESSFSGKIADIRVFGRSLSTEEAVSLSRCSHGAQDYISPSAYFSSGMVETHLLQMPHLCQRPPPEFLVLFESFEGSDYEAAKTFCELMEGRLFNETDDIDAMAHEISKSREIHEASKTVFLFTKDAADNKLCNILKVENRTTGPFHHMQKYMCSFHLTGIACAFVREKVVYMKGDEIVKYKLYPYRGSLVLQTDTDDTIKRWRTKHKNCLSQQLYGHTVAIADLNSVGILGRRMWRFLSSNDTFQFSLSFCGPEEYSCDDGRCIELRQRCDSLIQCVDFSDESALCSLLDVPHRSYWKKACPVSTPVINLNVTLIGYNQVNLEENSFAVTLLVTTIWKDERLKFSNIHDNLNTLQEVYANMIWVPDILFENARYIDNLQLQKKQDIEEEYTLHRVENGTQRVINGHEVLSYDGSQIFLSRTIQYMFVFTCNYDLSAFPFDTQLCNMTLRLRGPQGCRPQWNVREGGVQVNGGSQSISVYTVSPLRFLYDPEMETGNVTKVQILVIFTRKFESFLLTTFMPCAVLCALSQLTLTHFHVEDFPDRITVTLSLLIVLASLFSQMSSTLPSSPNPKCVDFFFFYCILRVSFVFILHSCIEKSFRAQKKEKLFVTRQPKCKAPSGISQKLTKLRKPSPDHIKKIGLFVIAICDIIIISWNVFAILLDKKQKQRQYNSALATEDLNSTCTLV